MNLPPEPAPALIHSLLQQMLAEDLGSAGDVTTDAIAEPGITALARVIFRRAGRVAGLGAALETFRLLDPATRVERLVPEGEDVPAATTVAVLRGPARAILSGERAALNLLGLLSGVATATGSFVRAVAGSKARIAATRKTTPGLRVLEKYAVGVGGGLSHRFGLYDGILIKDNHIALAGGVGPAVARVRDRTGRTARIQVEVDTLDQLAEVVELGVHAVLLDNMDVATLRRAVALIDGRMLTEASGGVTLETAPAIAATGVDLISVGWITHSAPWHDATLEVVA